MIKFNHVITEIQDFSNLIRDELRLQSPYCMSTSKIVFLYGRLHRKPTKWKCAEGGVALCLGESFQHKGKERRGTRYLVKHRWLMSH